MRLRLVQFTPLLLAFAAALQPALAQTPETGYAVRKPVIGGACPLCPWGVMSEVVKKAMQPYGWDIQICYVCAGGPREARMVAGAMKPERRPRDTDTHPLPNGPIDFGVTGSQFLQWAYLGMDVFANDPEGPRRHLRMVANIQEPTWLLVAVKSDSGITSLSDIVEKRLAVDMVATTGIGGGIVPGILNFYGLSKERVESFGGTYRTGYEHDEEADVIIGFGSMVNAPEYRLWYEASQKFDLKYLELAPDLRAKLAKDLYLEQQNIPLGLFRGVDRPIPTVARTGAVIYGRTDMPDEFAYTLAKAMDEHQDLLQWTHMNFSYNWRTVWKAFDVPLHPGAARYYKERGYMK
jgi:TRAP transporter TAXI family solute receptor